MMISWAMLLFTMSVFFFIKGCEYFLYMKVLMLDVLCLSCFSCDIKGLFYFDGMGMIFIGVVCLISSMVLCYSVSYMSGDPLLYKFLILIMLFVGSMILLIVSMNLSFMLIGWDGLGLISYLLVIFYQNVEAKSSGMVTILTNKLGDVGLVLGLIFLMNFSGWDIYLYSIGKDSNMLVGLMIFGAVITKSAQTPFSAWLPQAMAAPTPVSALVHSSTLVTAGVYVVIRCNIYYTLGEMSHVLLCLSIFTMFISGFSAVFEMDMKKIIALSTLSQLGLMMMSLSLGLYNIAFIHLIIHAIFKSTLFLCAGAMIHGSGGNQDLRLYMLGGWSSSVLMMVMLVSSLCLMGFPFLGGFYSKDLIYESLYYYNNNILLFFCSLLAIMFTVIYSLRLAYYCSWKSVGSFYINNMEMSWFLKGPIFVLGFYMIFVGGSVSWLLLVEDVMVITLGVYSITMILIFYGVLIISLLLFMMFILDCYSVSNFMSGGFYQLDVSYSLSSTMMLGGTLRLMDLSWLELISGKTWFSSMIQWKGLLSVQVSGVNKSLLLLLMLLLLLIF